MQFERKLLFLGFRNILAILPSVILFGLIFGFTGGLSELPLWLISSMSFIIFAGSAQFFVLLLIITGEETLIAIVIAGILINFRHFLYGAALHMDLKATGLKRFLMAYLLTDEAFLVTTYTKKNEFASENNFHLDDVLIGAGFTLWSVWNVSTIIGYLATQEIKSSFTLSPDLVVAATFLGLLVIQWQNYPSEHKFLSGLMVISFILSFFLQSSLLLITILLSGAVIAMISQFYLNINQKKQVVN